MWKIILALAMLMASSAQAGVVYNWVTTNTTATMDVVNARIEIRDSAWLAGGFVYQYPNDCLWGNPPGCFADPDGPVISFFFSGATGEKALNMDFGAATGFMFPRDQTYQLSVLGGLLAGSILAGNGETDVDMASDPQGTWTVTRYISDGGQDCGPGSNCQGATGRWVLDGSTIPVPLPGTLALLGLGLLLVARWR